MNTPIKVWIARAILGLIVLLFVVGFGLMMIDLYHADSTAVRGCVLLILVFVSGGWALSTLEKHNDSKKP